MWEEQRGEVAPRLRATFLLAVEKGPIIVSCLRAPGEGDNEYVRRHLAPPVVSRFDHQC